MAVPTRAGQLTLTRWALALAGVAALLAVGFFTLSRAVVAGRTADVDRRILRAMRNPGDLSDPLGPRWFEELCRDVTALGGTAVLALLVGGVVAFFWLSAMRRAALYVAVAIVTGVLLSRTLKTAFDRPRPDLVPHGAQVYTSSFPSGHSTMAATVYLTLGMTASRFVGRKRLKALLLGLAMLVTAAVGVSRVYLGVHWPSDVLAGWAVGVAWALACWCAATWLQQHGMVEEEVDPTPVGEHAAAD